MAIASTLQTSYEAMIPCSWVSLSLVLKFKESWRPRIYLCRVLSRQVLGSIYMASKIGRWVKIFLKKSIAEDHLLVVLLGGGQFPQGGGVGGGSENCGRK